MKCTMVATVEACAEYCLMAVSVVERCYRFCYFLDNYSFG